MAFCDQCGNSNRSGSAVLSTLRCCANVCSAWPTADIIVPAAGVTSSRQSRTML